MWAEKEMHNLMKMGKFGIPVPEVILLRKHVLVFLEARSFCQPLRVYRWGYPSLSTNP
jgi:serine/threonine-protein kinase RIO1